MKPRHKQNKNLNKQVRAILDAISNCTSIKPILQLGWFGTILNQAKANKEIEIVIDAKASGDYFAYISFIYKLDLFDSADRAIFVQSANKILERVLNAIFRKHTYRSWGNFTETLQYLKYLTRMISLYQTVEVANIICLNKSPVRKEYVNPKDLIEVEPGALSVHRKGPYNEIYVNEKVIKPETKRGYTHEQFLDIFSTFVCNLNKPHGYPRLKLRDNGVGFNNLDLMIRTGLNDIQVGDIHPFIRKRR